MTKLLVTLDFDGVISPIDKQRDFEAEEAWKVLKLGAFPCAIAEETLELLNELAEVNSKNPAIEVVWATSWEDLTEHFSEQSQGIIPDFRWISTRPSKAESIYGEAQKLGADAILSCEDSGSVHRELSKLLNPRVKGDPTTIIRVEPTTERGLEADHLATIRWAVSSFGRKRNY